jgi:SulP family sulfate permease
MALVFFLTVFIDLIIAVGAGVTLASLLITYRIAKESRIAITEVEEPRIDTESERTLESRHHIRVIDITGPFFFGSSSQLVDRVDTVLETKTVIIDCTKVPFMDLSAVFALDEMVERLTSNGITVFLVVNPVKKEKLMGVGALKPLPPKQIFFDRETALQTAVEKNRETIK